MIQVRESGILVNQGAVARQQMQNKPRRDNHYQPFSFNDFT